VGLIDYSDVVIEYMNNNPSNFNLEDELNTLHKYRKTYDELKIRIDSLKSISKYNDTDAISDSIKIAWNIYNSYSNTINSKEYTENKLNKVLEPDVLKLGSYLGQVAKDSSLDAVLDKSFNRIFIVNNNIDTTHMNKYNQTKITITNAVIKLIEQNKKK
jgi:hypothetical protein